MHASTPPTHLLYLHGFRSSPQSAKAQMVQAHALARSQAAHHSGPAGDLPDTSPPLTWCCPQLPPSPQGVVDLIEDLTRDWPSASMAVIGSSLGGFFATLLAQRRGCRAALINPAVLPHRDLARHMGELGYFHDPQTRFLFGQQDVDALHALAPYPITDPQRYWLLVAQGDEVLDWKEMRAHYPGAQLKLLPASDHAVSDFEDHLPDLLDWLGWPART